ELGRCKRTLADPRMAVRGHDQVGSGGNRGSFDQFGIGLHDDFDAGGAGGCREAVFAIMHNDPCDFDPMVPEHVEGRYAEMARADEGDPHHHPFPDFTKLLVKREYLLASITCRGKLSPHRDRAACGLSTAASKR